MRTEPEPPSPAIDGGISFFCVARGSAVLHSRGGDDADLEALSAACLARTPPHHARYSHTARGRTFAFLSGGDGRAYFAIAGAWEGSGSAAALRFLERLRDASEREGARERAIEVSGGGSGGDRGTRTIAAGAEEKASGGKGLRRSLSVRARARARKLWWRHVRVVLALDALLCAALLGAWFAVCGGLKCLDY